MPLRRIALLTVFAFGCATVRVPVGSVSQPSDAPGVIAPPITELFIESSEEVPPEQAAKADAQARAALAQALAGREIPASAAGATDAVLFVRERAVATTEARQSQQTWAKVGIIASIVLIVAAVVIVVASGKGGSGHSAASGKGSSAHVSSAKPVATPVSVKPRAFPATPRSVPPRITPSPAPRVPVAAPYYGWRRGPPVYVGFYFDFWIPPRPMVLAPEPSEEIWYDPEPPVPMAPDGPPPPEGSGVVAENEPPPPPDPDAVEGVALQLPPLAEAVSFKVEDRGFFAGPCVAIQLDLLDRATGRLLWSKAVKADADPLDPSAVAQVVDEAFKGIAWAPRRR